MKGVRLMFVSDFSQIYLIFYGSLALVGCLALTFMHILWIHLYEQDLDKDDYLTTSRAIGLMGLITFILWIIPFGITKAKAPTQIPINFNWDILLVVPGASILGALIAPIIVMTLTKTFTIATTAIGFIVKCLNGVLDHWCNTLTHLSARKK